MLPNKTRLAALALTILLAAPAMAQEGLIEIYQRALTNDPAASTLLECRTPWPLATREMSERRAR